jgi:hypothetical protein
MFEQVLRTVTALLEASLFGSYTLFKDYKNKANSLARVRERPPLVDEVSANFC